MSSSSNDLTRLLQASADGDRTAADRLFAIVYDELKRMAGGKLRKESSQTLQSTALVHEVWLKLIGGRDPLDWSNRRHFFAAAAIAMQRILVDAARARKRVKRGGENRVTFELREDDLVSIQDDELLALDEALEMLKQEHPQKADLVRLRYFAGFTSAQAAEQLGVSTATAERYWTFARAWLRARMDPND